MSYGDERYDCMCSEPVLRAALAGTLDRIADVEQELRNLTGRLRKLAEADTERLIPRILASEQLSILLLQALTITAGLASDPDVSAALEELGLSAPLMHVRCARAAVLPLLLDSCDPPTRAKPKSMATPAKPVGSEINRQKPGLAGTRRKQFVDPQA